MEYYVKIFFPKKSPTIFLNLANFELRWSVTQASVGVLYQRKKPMFIEKGENIDQYFCNEEMASANRSHPVADAGKCLALKNSFCKCKFKHCVFDLTLPFDKSFANWGEIDLRKQSFLLFDLTLLHMSSTEKLLANPPLPRNCNFQRKTPVCFYLEKCASSFAGVDQMQSWPTQAWIVYHLQIYRGS